VKKYKGYPIYIRNFKNVFEYLTVIKGQIYTAHIMVRPKWYRWFFGKPYSKKEIAGIVRYMQTLAETTIDTILSNKKK